MKKIIATLMLCIISTMCFGQKTFSSSNFVTETVDDFGDKTGNMKVGIIANGYFSNSATTNSCAELIISCMEKKAWTSLYKYCGDHPTDDAFVIVATGTTTNETIRLRSRFIEYSFIELCKNNDTIKIKMSEESKYGSTTAVFKLFNCTEFYSNYIDVFGEPPYITIDVNTYNLTLYSTPVIGRYLLSAPTNSFRLVFDKLMGSMNVKGRFQNGDDISCNFDNKIYVNGVEIKDDWLKVIGDLKIDVFMKNVKPNDEISVSNKKTNEIEKITITQEMYDAIIEFFQLK